MSNRKFILPAIALTALLGGTGIATLQPVAAQTAAPPATASATPAPAMHRPPRERPSHIEGRIAFLKAELKITPAQEPQFDKVAQALRQNSEERRHAFEQIRTTAPDQPRNALQHLEARARFAAMRAQENDRFLAAFRPLYDSLSADQKKSADDLMTPHRHFGRRGI